MSNPIEGAFKRYNANSKNNDVGDCVKRSLTIAYGLDYDTVSSELNKIKRQLGESKFNIQSVYTRFIRNHGLEWSGYCEAFTGSDEPLTVSGFCEMYDTGVYLIVCGKSPGQTTHMVCIIDGDFWDSWDCSSWYVTKLYQISGNKGTEFSEVTVDDISEDIISHVKACIEKSNAKMPYARFEFHEPERLNKYSITQYIVCKIDDSNLVGLYSWMWTPSYEYTIKVNPRLSLEDNLRVLKSKLWTRVREWAYAIRKEIEDTQKAFQIKSHPNFHGDRMLLAKLPEWCHARVTYASDNGDSGYYDRYEVGMDAFPDDPRYDKEPHVRFYAETLTELRHNLESYRTDFSRFGYDY